MVGVQGPKVQRVDIFAVVPTRAATPGLDKAMRTKFQLFARIPLWAECFVLPPLVIGSFIFVRLLSVIPYLTDILNRPPNLLFLRDQYDFLLVRGVDPMAAEQSLRLFEILIWVLVPILLLRLALSPFLFGLINWREKRRNANVSIMRLVFGWLLMVSGVYAATDIRSSSSVVGLAYLLKASPRAYICLEAFIFVMGSVLAIEGLTVAVMRINASRQEFCVGPSQLHPKASHCKSSRD